MKKFLTLLLILTVFLQCNYAHSKTAKDNVVKNKLFSITIPKDLNGTYVVKKYKDKISIYHKESKKAGFGGFAFAIKAYENPSDHAVLPGSRKIGELTDKNGKLYDMVLKHPTDVQHDYVKNPQAPESFMSLYNLGKNAEIQGIKGATYFKDKGMKGQDLYKDILTKHISAINEKWDSAKLEKENMSYMYNVLSQGNNENILDKIGYIYYDVNGDGIDELFIGEIAQENWKGVVYDIYTMVDRKPVHVVSGGTRNRYYVCDEAFVCNEYSSGANESGVRVYFLEENSTVLFPQVNFKYDAYENPDKPWFISYSDGQWENVSEYKYNERKSTFSSYLRFDYIPLSRLK